MFQLMNKDKAVATFEISKVMGSEIATCLTILDKLPIGCREGLGFTEWVKNRYAAKHRSHLAGYLNIMSADTMSGFIKLTHSISINDTYWIKEDHENLTWSQVSPYTNNFDEVIQHLSFDGVGLQGVHLSSTSPEFGTNGAYEKCWVRENNGIYLYKRGTEGFSNAGLEPYSEFLASQIFVKMKAGIPYDVVKYRGRIASKCKLFTNENIGFAPYTVLNPIHNSMLEILEFFSNLGCEESFKRMLVCDAITFNTDRHHGNFGCLYNTDTQELLSMAPCFDYNLSLFPMEVNDAFVDVSSFIGKYTPKIGDSFIEVARGSLTPAIRADLINLKGFKYEYDGDDKFTKDRVDWLTSLSNQQINHILGTTNVYMYTSPNKTCVSNIYKYRMKNHLTEEQFQEDVPRLMKVFGINHMSELEEKIADLL